MENLPNNLAPHPQFLEILFAFKSKVSAVFKEILGLHEMHHLALTRINKNNQLLTFSSTPAMEFNLFSSPLWRYDKTYHPRWFHLCTQSPWQRLYNQTRYDELYYLKQIRHAFPLGLSLASQKEDQFVIYSLASHKSCPHTQELFFTQQEDFYKIGQYCYDRLTPLFDYCDLLTVDSSLRSV